MISKHFGHIISQNRVFFPSSFSYCRQFKMSQPLSAIVGGENIPEQPQKMQKMDHEPVLRVKKLSDRATLPVRGSAGAAGYDLAR